MGKTEALAAYLNSLADCYEQPRFVDDDPISIPHAFDDPRDKEIIGLYAALLAWGRRDTLLKKMAVLCELMDYAPFQFVSRFDNRSASRLATFKHRTFQPDDAVWLTRCLGAALVRFGSLESCFATHISSDSPHVGPAIEGFSAMLLSILPETPRRLRKHLARPSTGSACKRLSMYLRWMVRPGPVDLGLWKRINPGQLVLPLDVHSGRQARALGLLTRKQNDWRAVMELTDRCRALCPHDPARYDFAFFGSGISGEALDRNFVVSGHVWRQVN